MGSNVSSATYSLREIFILPFTSFPRLNNGKNNSPENLLRHYLPALWQPW